MHTRITSWHSILNIVYLYLALSCLTASRWLQLDSQHILLWRIPITTVKCCMRGTTWRYGCIVIFVTCNLPGLEGLFFGTPVQHRRENIDECTNSTRDQITWWQYDLVIPCIPHHTMMTVWFGHTAYLIISLHYDSMVCSYLIISLHDDSMVCSYLIIPWWQCGLFIPCSSPLDCFLITLVAVAGFSTYFTVHKESEILVNNIVILKYGCIGILITVTFLPG